MYTETHKGGLAKQNIILVVKLHPRSYQQLNMCVSLLSATNDRQVYIIPAELQDPL